MVGVPTAAVSWSRGRGDRRRSWRSTRPRPSGSSIPEDAPARPPSETWSVGTTHRPPPLTTVACERSRALRSAECGHTGHGALPIGVVSCRKRRARCEDRGPHRPTGVGAVGGRDSRRRPLRRVRWPRYDSIRRALHAVHRDRVAACRRDVGPGVRDRRGAGRIAVCIRRHAASGNRLVHRARQSCVSSGHGTNRHGSRSQR